MSMTQEALKLALEALEKLEKHNRGVKLTTVKTGVVAYPAQIAQEAITALRRALEQPAQQVVDSDEKAGAYMEARLWEFIDMAAAWPKASPDPRTWDHVMVYAPKPAQRTWVGLTDEEIDAIYTGVRAVHHEINFDLFARAIEAKIKDKNS